MPIDYMDGVHDSTVAVVALFQCNEGLGLPEEFIGYSNPFEILKGLIHQREIIEKVVHNYVYQVFTPQLHFYINLEFRFFDGGVPHESPEMGVLRADYKHKI